MADLPGVQRTPLTRPTRRRRGCRPLAVDARGLSPLLGGVGVRTIRTWDAAGRLPVPVRVGGKVLWLVRGPTGILAWLAAGAPDRATWTAMCAARR